MNSRTFTLDELQEYEMDNRVWTGVIDSGRWTRYDQVVFRASDDGKFYRIVVESGLTEYQDVDGEERYPDMHNGVLEAVEVEKRIKTVETTVWEAVE